MALLTDGCIKSHVSLDKAKFCAVAPKIMLMVFVGVNGNEEKAENVILS